MFSPRTFLNLSNQLLVVVSDEFFGILNAKQCSSTQTSISVSSDRAEWFGLDPTGEVFNGYNCKLVPISRHRERANDVQPYPQKADSDRLQSDGCLSFGYVTTARLLDLSTQTFKEGTNTHPDFKHFEARLSLDAPIALGVFFVISSPSEEMQEARVETSSYTDLPRDQLVSCGSEL